MMFCKRTVFPLSSINEILGGKKSFSFSYNPSSWLYSFENDRISREKVNNFSNFLIFINEVIRISNCLSKIILLI